MQNKKFSNSAKYPYNNTALLSPAYLIFPFSRFSGRHIMANNALVPAGKESFVIKPESSAPAVDWSQVPLLLKNYDKRTRLPPAQS